MQAEGGVIRQDAKRSATILTEVRYFRLIARLERIIPLILQNTEEDETKAVYLLV